MQASFGLKFKLLGVSGANPLKSASVCLMIHCTTHYHLAVSALSQFAGLRFYNFWRRNLDQLRPVLAANAINRWKLPKKIQLPSHFLTSPIQVSMGLISRAFCASKSTWLIVLTRRIDLWLQLNSNATLVPDLE